LQFVFMVFRWQLFIEMLGGVSIAWAHLALGFGRSMLAAPALPSSVGGDVVRVVAVADRVGATLAARSVIGDRVVGLAVLLALVVATLPFFAILIGAGVAFAAIAGISLGGFAVLLLTVIYSNWLLRLPLIGKYPALIAADLRQVFFKGRTSAAILLLTVATHLLSVVMVYELAHSLAVSISFVQCLLVVPPAMLITAVPISLGGWGVREGALAAGFVLVGASSEAGVATSLLFGLAGPLVGGIAELLMLLARARRVSSEDAV
jgi:uncharacterized membrane protein YbhN (UPF0104 family)